MNIKCLLFGHTHTVAQCDRPFQSQSYKGEPLGFMHFGLISKCDKCGKERSELDNTKLPIIMPSF